MAKYCLLNRKAKITRFLDFAEKFEILFILFGDDGESVGERRETRYKQPLCDSFVAEFVSYRITCM